MIDSYIPERPLSLYIHVPFCHKRCDYCAFYSSVFNSEVCDKYYRNLKLELEKVVSEVNKPFETVYLGGGNPILLGKERIVELLNIAYRYGKAKETTVEINPEDIDSSLSNLYPLVTRISTGLQSMSDDTLTLLNRRTRVKDNYKALEYLSSSHFIWNVDLITSVPTTEIADSIRDIDIVTSYNPDHISFYSLTFEENTPLIKRMAPIEEEEDRLFLVSGWHRLKEHGYDHYEISSFSHNGNECLHNKAYWSLSQYIGLGPSAESFLGYSDGVTMRNKESLEEFISSPSFDCERLTREECEESFLLTLLRTKYGINKKEYERRFNRSFDSLYLKNINMLDKSWYKNDEVCFSLTEEGMMMNDSIILTLSLSI